MARRSTAFVRLFHIIAMKSKLTLIGRLGAVLASLFCIVGGLVIIRIAAYGRGGGDGSSFVAMGFGLYFIGKGFFVGPMLWLVTEQICGGSRSDDHTA